MMKKLKKRLLALLSPQRVLSITRLGRVYLLMTVGIGIGALNTGNNLLYLVLGLMLSTIIVSGVLSERIIWRIGVRRRLPDAVFAREPFTLRYEVSTTRGFAFAVRVKEADTAQTPEAVAAIITPNTPSILRVTAQLPKRGPHHLSAVEVSTTYPLGLFQKKRTLLLDDQLLVLPARGFYCQIPDTSQGRTEGLDAQRHTSTGRGDFLGLKELQPFDPAKDIHWKKSAAVGKLLRIERSPEQRRLFNLTVQEHHLGEPLERNCEEVAALARRLLQQGHLVGLTTPTRRIAPHSGAVQERRLLEALALVGYEASP
jgi:uncharacterized protein (DUF58 family)